MRWLVCDTDTVYSSVYMPSLATGGSLFVGELCEYLGRWDKASKPAREKMLAEFVKNCRNMTGPELKPRFFGIMYPL